MSNQINLVRDLGGIKLEGPHEKRVRDVTTLFEFQEWNLIIEAPCARQQTSCIRNQVVSNGHDKHDNYVDVNP